MLHNHLRHVNLYKNKNDNVNPITANTYNNLLQNAPKPTSTNDIFAYIETVARINGLKFGIDDSSNNKFKSNAYHDCEDYHDSDHVQKCQHNRWLC